ncbi:MAG: ATP-binding protein [Verrucomicrobiota bacterium]
MGSVSKHRLLESSRGSKGHLYPAPGHPPASFTAKLVTEGVGVQTLRTGTAAVSVPVARILVVEDEGVVALDFQHRLQRLGYAVAGLAQDGDEAVRLAGESNPDLVLMDIQLGDGMGGIDAARAICRGREVPIVYVTANADDDTVKEAVRSSPSGYILKPFEDRELDTAIRIGLARHEMDLRLKESERWFQATLRSIADGLIATDARGLIQFFNPSASKITGWEPGEALGRALGDIFPLANDGTHGEDTDFFTAFRKPGSLPGNSRTAVLTRRDGERMPVEYRAAHIHDDRDRPAGLVVSFTDIRDRRRAEDRIRSGQERLARAHEKLVHKHEELQGFYHTVSHELKTPLTSAREFVALVLEGLAGAVTGTQREYLGIALESCDQMRTCINDMLDVTRLETGKMSLELRRGNPVELVQRLATRLRPAAERKGVELLCRAGLSAPEILMDETRIAQVVSNLLNNALKFTPAGGRIEVGIQPDAVGDGVLIVVRDTGCGIPASHQGRIFDRLYQVGREEEGGCTGLGLGLFICQELVRLHRGSIRVESVPGRGSTFTVHLPASPAGANARPPGESRLPRLPFESSTTD